MYKTGKKYLNPIDMMGAICYNWDEMFSYLYGCLCTYLHIRIFALVVMMRDGQRVG